MDKNDILDKVAGTTGKKIIRPEEIQVPLPPKMKQALRKYLTRSKAARAIYSILRQCPFAVPILQRGALKHRFGRSTIAHSVLELKRLEAITPVGPTRPGCKWRVAQWPLMTG